MGSHRFGGSLAHSVVNDLDSLAFLFIFEGLGMELRAHTCKVSAFLLSSFLAPPELADDHQLPLTWIPLMTTKTEDYGGQGASREPAGA